MGFLFAFGSLLALHLQAAGAPDLYIKDTPLDSGIEPNPDTGPMWVSEDIWVRNNPDPGYQPYPFPESSPPWIPLAHENPEYRDPKYSVPSYIYVRVRNRGSAPSTGNEELHVYWAKASTGLSWPAQWVDYLATVCGPTNLYGIEVTKPRKNAATATLAERNAYRDAVVAVGTGAGYIFPGGVSYFDKQDEVHETAPGVAHGSPAFTPWHRELLNRYEVLLQESNPLVRLLYWDWTTDPENSTGGYNLFTSAFMGASGRGSGGIPIGLPFSVLSPPPVLRNLDPSTTPPAISDASVFSASDYSTFRFNMENFAHNVSHGYIGGGGNMSYLNAAAEDPFFFLLHGNVDRLWAQWQRDPAVLGRLEPSGAYGLDSASPSITSIMAPWDGTTGIRPWTVGDGYIINKTPKSPSIVSPPIYDVAPLRIPALAPGEAVVLQIPWHPPNPANYACFGGDQGHVCLLARVETANASPFGMTFAETADVFTNTRNNNNIAWKNITVVDNFPGASQLATILIRNPGRKAALAGLRFNHVGDFSPNFFKFGTLTVDLKADLFKRWRAAGGAAQGVEVVPNTTRVQFFSPQGFLQGIPLQPGEAFGIDVQFTLNPDYTPLRGQPIQLDLIQTGTPDDPQALVGGQRFQVNFGKLLLVKRGSSWRYFAEGSLPGAGWNKPGFDDSRWPEGTGELGYGNDPDTQILNAQSARSVVTTYFRKQFTLNSPQIVRSLLLGLKRDDGAVVYLNGVEVLRVGLPPPDALIGPDVYANQRVEGLAEKVFWPTDLSNLIPLLRTENLLAVEVHQAADPLGANLLRTDADLSFDLELCANAVGGNTAPNIVLTRPLDGSTVLAGGAIPLQAEALDVDGKIQGVSFFADDKLLQTVTSPPYQFQWLEASPGRHRIRAVATDDQQGTAVDYASIVVSKNPAPVAHLTQPSDGQSFESGMEITLLADALDLGGAVAKVDFLLHRGHRFVDRYEVVGTVKEPPFTFTLPTLPAGHYGAVARATDDTGLIGWSSPAHFEVMPDLHIPLSIVSMDDHLMLIWEAPGTVLERSPLITGPWKTVENAASPFLLKPEGKSSFFRLRSL